MECGEGTDAQVVNSDGVPGAAFVGGELDRDALLVSADGWPSVLLLERDFVEDSVVGCSESVNIGGARSGSG